MPRPGKKMGDAERFARYVKITDHGLEWDGPMNGRYGRFNLQGTLSALRRTYAHRYSWTYFNGPLESGQVVDHLSPGCPKTCVTPDHLIAQESQGEHNRAGWARGEFANTWATRKPLDQDPITGQFLKVSS